jgi:pimeloyl-ACP methyl ester carboxylesterase
VGAEWETIESGPLDAGRTALLLPGGLHTARSYAEVLAEPALADVHLVAATLPGHGGAPPPVDFSVERYARDASDLATSRRCDVVVGFSFGATVALEMAASGAFTGPVVLLGISLSTRDEPALLQVVDRLGAVLGTAPSLATRAMMGVVTKHARVSPGRRAELLADFRKNDARSMRDGLHAYVTYLRRHGAPARRLCDAGVPVWVVHAEKGDGGLTQEERRTLVDCANATVVTIPGTSYFIPNEEPALVAALIVDALDRAQRHL